MHTANKKLFIKLYNMLTFFYSFASGLSFHTTNILQLQGEEDAKYGLYVYFKINWLIQNTDVLFQISDPCLMMPHAHADDLGMSYAASRCQTNITIC